MINSAVFTPLYAPGLRKVIFESFTYMPTEYDKFLNVGSSRRQYEEDYRMAGFGDVPQKPEGSSIIYDDPVPDIVLRWVWTPFGKGFRATHEAMADELYGQLRKMATAMGKAFRTQNEIEGASVLNLAFTAPAAPVTSNQGYEGAAGRSLCASAGVGAGGAHVLLRGGTARNAPTAAVDLGVTSLQDALVDFERFVDESNVPIVYIPRMLTVAPENSPLARELLGSQFKPFTADNEINVLQSAGLKLMVSHYMTDTDAWFLSADKSDHDLWFIWREKFQTGAADDFDTGDGKMKGYMRFGVGFGDWRGFWGSPGV
jgi:hypothetical protein